jgi:hypothetical protein
VIAGIPKDIARAPDVIVASYVDAFNQFLYENDSKTEAEADSHARSVVVKKYSPTPAKESRVFCATGEGGGTDATCSPKDSAGGGAGQSPGGGLKPPSKPHNIRVPKDPKRLTIDQADSAMKQMGYEVGETVTQKEGGSWVSKTAYSDSGGKSVTLTATDVMKFVYANHSDPDIAKIKVPKPRKRRGS